MLTAATAANGLRARAETKASPVAANTKTVNRKNLVATQVKAYAWQDEGIHKLLDNLQEKGLSEGADSGCKFRGVTRRLK